MLLLPVACFWRRRGHPLQPLVFGRSEGAQSSAAYGGLAAAGGLVKRVAPDDAAKGVAAAQFTRLRACELV